MQREFARLADGPFDVLVVGGGIYGAWTAYDCVLRGLRTALVEQGDWAGGTSSASSKLVHGGLRYLEQGRIGLVRHALRERALLLRSGSHRVRPLRFVIPMVGSAYEQGRIGVGLGNYNALVDVLRRRVPVAILAHLSEAVIQRAAALAGDALEWDAQRRVDECAGVRALVHPSV